MTLYTLEALRASLGLSRSVLAGLIKAGFVTPSRGAHREYRFSFQDMVLLRTAHGLQTANIAPRKILRALAQLRAQLPQELPLSGLRISSKGSHITVREGGAEWAVESGQLLMDFEVRARPEVTSTRLHTLSSPGESEPETSWFAQGVNHESSGDRKAAETAYRNALQTTGETASAALNLGVLLCDDHRPGEAVAVYRHAIELGATEPLLHYNLAIALEDAGAVVEALVAYHACLKLAPGMADAHFNAARLHELAGEKTLALRHYSAYRRLQR